MNRELTDAEVFGEHTPDHVAPQLFVKDFDQVLGEMQRAWVEVIGLRDVPPVILLPNPDSPKMFGVFSWPSPWLH